MELHASSTSLDSVNVLVHETGSDNDVYGERVRNDERKMEHEVAEASSDEHHSENS